MPPRKMTIEELRKELAARERQQNKLVAKREKLLSDLEQIEKDIAALGGETTAKPKRGRPKKKTAKRGRPAARKTKVSKRGRRVVTKRRPGESLTDYVKAALAKSSEGMRVKDIAAAVTKSGYKTVSKDFYGIVAATLRDENVFKRVGRGIYKLA